MVQICQKIAKISVKQYYNLQWTENFNFTLEFSLCGAKVYSNTKYFLKSCLLI